MRFPDFVIIGAAKCGTTTLYRHLLDDDRFYLSAPKEPEFFARDDVFSKGIEWYSSLFDGAEESQICGEASTIYTLSPLFPMTAARMHKAIPNARLIYVVRNPVKRAYSYYVQLMKNYQNYNRTTKISVSFDQFIFDNECSDCSEKLAGFDKHLPYCPELITSGGMYYRQISEYLKYYDMSRIHVMIFEDFLSDPVEELKKLYNFLGVSDSKLNNIFKQHRENISEDHFKAAFANQLIKNIKSNRVLSKFFGIMPNDIKGRLKQIAFSKTLYRFKGQSVSPDKMSESTQEYLRNLYFEPTVELSRFIGRDLIGLWKLGE